MKKIFAWLAVVPLTIATESMIYPVWAECQPDRYGNIIDLGDGNCGQKIELQPPDAQRLIWDQSTVSDIYFPDWIFDSSLPRPPFYVHTDTGGGRTISYQGARYVEHFFTEPLANELREWERLYVDCQTGWVFGIFKYLDGSIESWLTTPTAVPWASSETRSPDFTYKGIPVWTANKEWIDSNIGTCSLAIFFNNTVPYSSPRWVVGD